MLRGYKSTLYALGLILFISCVWAAPVLGISASSQSLEHQDGSTLQSDKIVNETDSNGTSLISSPKIGSHSTDSEVNTSVSFDNAVPITALQNLSDVSNNLNSTRTTSITNEGASAILYNGQQQELSVANRSTDDQLSQPSKVGTAGSALLQQDNVSYLATNSGIIDSDSRTRISDSDVLTSFPYAPVVELRIITKSDRRAICSGVIISEEDMIEHSYHVLTAGHCVYQHSQGGWIDIQSSKVDGDPASRVVPAANSSEHPFGAVAIDKMRAYKEWTERQNPAHDLALLTLSRRIGKETGSLGYVAADSDNAIYSHYPSRVVGYPGDKQTHTMWSSVGSGRGTVALSFGAGNLTHKYNMDIYSGMSGGPVWVEGYPQYQRPRVVSVNAYAVDSNRDGVTDYNLGPRLTYGRVSDLRTWMETDDPDQLKNDDYENNNNFSSSTVIKQSTSLKNLRLIDGENDYFEFNTSKGQTIEVNISSSSSMGNINLEIYGPDHQLQQASQSEKNNERLRIESVDAGGTYHVRVDGVGDTTVSYQLNISVITPSQHGAVEGIVTNGTGTPIPNATVQIRAQDTDQIVETATTNQSGVYEIPNVSVGYYNIDAIYNNQTGQSTRVHVTQNNTTVVNISIPNVILRDQSRIQLTSNVPARISPGELIVVKYTLQNNGLPNAAGGAISVNVSSPLTVVSKDTKFIGIQSSPPEIGESVSKTFEVRVPSNVTASGGTVSARAELQSTNDQLQTTVSTDIIIDRNTTSRFDVNGQPGIQASEVVDAIVAYKTNSQVGGQPVTSQDIVDLIVQYNTS